MASSLSCSPDFLSPPNPDPLSLLRRCTNLRHLTQIHAKLIRSSNLDNNPLTATNLLRQYSSYGKLHYATSIFSQIKNPPTFSYNLIIRAHTINGSPHQALVYYTLMLCSGLVPDKFTYPFVIKACGESLDARKGKMVHAQVVKTGFCCQDMFVRNTLMDMYLKCGDLRCARLVFDEMSMRNVVSWTTMLSGFVAAGELEAARSLFDEMPVRNVVSWSVMINGYVSGGKPQEAFELFSEMQGEGVVPNEFTLVSLLRGCTELGSVRLGGWVHDYAFKNGFELGVYLGTALIDMYSKCGSLDEARKVFDLMGERSLATWNSMITSLGVHGCGEEALLLFEQMLEENVTPDAITFVGVLSACVQTERLDEGLQYFKYMTEVCGIVPVLEHYVCMFEIWGHAKSQEQCSTQETEIEVAEEKLFHQMKDTKNALNSWVSGALCGFSAHHTE